MTVDESFRLVSYIANKETTGVITPAQFNLLAPIAQLSFINDRLGNAKKYKQHDPVPEYGWGISQKVREELGVLYTSDTVNLTTGVGSQPSDCLYLDTLLTPSGTQRIIEEKTVDEYMILVASVIKPPTVTFPIFYRSGNGSNVQITMSPTSFATAQIFYVKRPTTPVWAYTVVNDEPVYSAGGSQDFQTAQITHLAICNLILQAVGINLDMEQLEQYSQLEQAKGS